MKSLNRNKERESSNRYRKMKASELSKARKRWVWEIG